MKPVTPQEKKRLSYARDGRNEFGSNDKASRRLIPLAKKRASRAYRKLTTQRLPKNVPMLDTDSAVEAETAVRSVRRSHWRKTPDIPLGEAVRRQKARRERVAKPPSDS